MNVYHKPVLPGLYNSNTTRTTPSLKLALRYDNLHHNFFGFVIAIDIIIIGRHKAKWDINEKANEQKKRIHE